MKRYIKSSSELDSRIAQLAETAADAIWDVQTIPEWSRGYNEDPRTAEMLSSEDIETLDRARAVLYDLAERARM